MPPLSRPIIADALTSAIRNLVSTIPPLQPTPPSSPSTYELLGLRHGLTNNMERRKEDNFYRECEQQHEETGRTTPSSSFSYRAPTPTLSMQGFNQLSLDFLDERNGSPERYPSPDTAIPLCVHAFRTIPFNPLIPDHTPFINFGLYHCEHIGVHVIGCGFSELECVDLGAGFQNQDLGRGVVVSMGDIDAHTAALTIEFNSPLHIAITVTSLFPKHGSLVKGHIFRDSLNPRNPAAKAALRREAIGPPHIAFIRIFRSVSELLLLESDLRKFFGSKRLGYLQMHWENSVWEP